MHRMFRALAGTVLLFALALPTQAMAWGGRGHRLIGDLAYARLTPEAKALVDRLIALSSQQEGAEMCPVKSLADASTWPDCVRGNDMKSYDYMGELHYVNRSIHGPAPDGTFCAAGNCVTEAVRRAELVLADREAPALVRLLALEQLAHFLEDMHQPLHAGDNGDRGGNDVFLLPLFPQSGDVRGPNFSNLHSLWDGELVNAAVGRDLEQIGTVRTLIDQHAAEWEGQTIEQMAAESWQISRDYAYPRLPIPPRAGQPRWFGGQIDQAYVDGAVPLVRVQLAKAAVRLAEALNRAAQTKDKGTKRRK